MTQEIRSNVQQFKAKAITLSELVARHGVTLSHSQSLEILAKVEGARNWSALSAELNSQAASAKKPVDDLTEDELASFMSHRIENGEWGLEDIPVRLARFGLMDPADFVSEMRERMENAQAEGADAPYQWYEVALYAGEETFLGKQTVPAKSPRAAKQAVFEKLWDDRLDEPCRSFVDAVDDPSAEAVAEWIGHHYDEDALDMLVHDAAQEDSLASVNSTDDENEQEAIIASREAFASDINNGGFVAQVQYLMDTLGSAFTAQVLEHLEFDGDTAD